MPSIVLPLLILFLSNFLLQPSTCAVPANIENIHLDDISSLWDKFPAIISKIKEAVNRFRCPKGWRRLGGSCYYLSNFTSTPDEANHTCNLLHSNHSQLMQIRNTIELFYAAHVLTKNNLSMLMIELDPHLLKGKHIAELLMNDQGRWQRMKEKFREARIKYYKLKTKVLDELRAAGLRISRRSKKIKQSIKKKKDRFRTDSDLEYYDYNSIDGEENKTITTINSTNIILSPTDDDYEEDDIDSPDDADEFEQIEDIRGICDQLDWNVINNDTNIYILSTYLIGEKIVCSLSDIEINVEYDHVCEYVLDFCFANIVCGKHGYCVNSLSGFKCTCSFLYGGVLCQKISQQGKQILIGIGIILFLYSLSFKPIRLLLWFIVKRLIDCCKMRNKERDRKKNTRKQETNGKKDDKRKLVPTNRTDDEDEFTDDERQRQIIEQPQERRLTFTEQIMDIFVPKAPDPLLKPIKRDLVRMFWVGGMSVFFLSLLFIVTTVRHFTSFQFDITDDVKLDSLVNETIRLVTQCEHISDYRMGNLIFFPVALALIAIFSWSIKREKKFRNMCDGRPGLIPPIEPFRTGNRFTTATVFGILAFEVLKIFEELLFASADPMQEGVLVALLLRIAEVILVGLRYYPILASLQLRNIVARFFAFLYILADISYTIVREGSCMGFLPLSRTYSAIEEAKLRMELGTWFIIYGLIKNTPHFLFLSYIGAELTVRFAYDSVYVPYKKKRSIWLSPVTPVDEYQFAKYYVTKLFRGKNLPTQYTMITSGSRDRQSDNVIDHEHEAELQKKKKNQPPRVQTFFDRIYKWDDDFRFTTMATCTYTVAFVFLYYLACTLVFLYISRTTGHISFLKFYVESTLNIEIKGWSFTLEIILSAVIAVILFAIQLFIGMQNYKKHKLQLYKGIYEDVPSANNLKANSIASKSVHYSGFLVGYMAWGFIICFHLIFFILSALRVISAHMRYLELILAIVVPVMVVYLLKMISMSSAGKFLFIQELDEKLNLKNRKTYSIFLYFNFFADCFLGIASCIIRLIKATFLNVVFMARLDCSFLGRPLEKFDLGFAAYVSYLHMEVTHTHPIMLAFCYSLYDDVIKRRPKGYDDDECCIGPGEIGDDDEDDEEKKKQEQTTMKNIPIRRQPDRITKKPTDDESIEEITTGTKETSVQINNSPSMSVNKKTIVVHNPGDDDDEGLSVREITPKMKPPSQVSSASEKSSQKSSQRKSKQKKSVTNSDDDRQIDDDDGGPQPPSDSTVARLIPQQPPRLPTPSAPHPEVPVRQDLPPKPPKREPSDDEDDDDGGLKPKSISTIARAMPQKQPRLVPIQQSSNRQAASASVSRAVKQKDEDDNDDDDDGGLDPRKIAKQKQEAEEKRKKKKESKEKKAKIVQKLAADDDDDEDGGVSKQKQAAAAAAKKKQAIEAKKNKKKLVPKGNSDEDDDDGGIPRRPEVIKKKKSDKPSKPKIIEEDDEDDDGGLKVKNYDFVRKIIPSKQPELGIERSKHEQSPEEAEDGSMRSSKPRQPQEMSSKSYDTVGRMVPKISVDFRSYEKEDRQRKSNDKQENHYDTIPTDEERFARATAIYSPPSYEQAAGPGDLYLMRTISYREAQQSTPPLVSRRLNSLRSNSAHNDDSSHYSEVTDGTIRSGVINRSYSNTGSIQSSSSHSIKQLTNKQSSPTHTLKEEIETLNTDVESEAEEEEEEEEVKQPEPPPSVKSQNKKRAPLPDVSTAYATLSHLVNPKEAAEMEKIRKRKQARFRWYLAYTILNNYHLFDLRKQVQSRLALLHIQRSNPIDEQQYAAAADMTPMSQLVSTEVEPSLEERRMKAGSSPAPPSADQRPPITRRMLSVPVPFTDEYPQSPAERYIAIRSCMLYDVNMQQPNTPRSPSVFDGPASSQQLAGPPIEASNRSLGFSTAPRIHIQPPSDERPAYRRELSGQQTSRISQPTNGTPVFQALSDSNQSTADYPTAAASSVTNSTTFHTQMSHAQHMQEWRQQYARKIQKKRPHCYVYGPPPQERLTNTISAAAILTPQIRNMALKQQGAPPTTADGQKLPTHSPFQYPRQSDNQIRTVDENSSRKSKNKQHYRSKTQQQQPVPPPRMDRVQEDDEQTPVKKQSTVRTTVVLHRTHSQTSSSSSTVTAV